MHLNHPERVHEHPAQLVSSVVREGSVLSNSMNKLYTPCYLCHDVVRGGSRRFNALEPSA